MTGTAKMPDRVTSKPSKAPLYAEALRIYLSSQTPDLTSIANQVGLRADTLIQYAERQAWSKRRVIVQRDLSQVRAATSAMVDDRLVTCTASHITDFLKGYEEITAKALSLKIEPEEDPQLGAIAKDDMRARLLLRKVTIMREVSKGINDLADIALSLGMVKGKEPTDDGQKLDHAKLTQLNIVINAAMQAEQKAAPSESAAIELENVGDDVI